MYIYALLRNFCVHVCGTEKTYMHVYLCLSVNMRVTARTRVSTFLYVYVAVDRHLR